jgi:hypothetical protein
LKKPTSGLVSLTRGREPENQWLDTTNLAVRDPVDRLLEFAPAFSV